MNIIKYIKTAINKHSYSEPFNNRINDIQSINVEGFKILIDFIIAISNAEVKLISKIYVVFF